MGALEEGIAREEETLKFVISLIVLRDSCAVYFYLFVVFIIIKYYFEIHLVLRGLSLWRYH